MDASLLDPESGRERIAAWKDRIDRLAADTKAMSEQLEQLRVTATDTNRICEVVLDSSGGLVELTFGERMRRSSPEVVSSAAMEAIGLAKRRLAERSQEIIESTMGADSTAGQAIAERVRRQLEPADAPDRNERW